MSDWIELSDLHLTCIVGLLDAEQRAPQRLFADVALRLPLDAAAGGDLSASVDYAAVEAQVTTLAEHGQWRLLESLAMATCRLLLAPPCAQERRARVDAVRVRLRKPDILGGRAVPGITVTRDAAWCDLAPRSPADGVRVDVLQETPLTGAYRVHLAAGARYTPPPGMALHVLAGRLHADDRVVSPGDRLARGGVAALHNPGSHEASLLGVARPPLG